MSDTMEAFAREVGREVGSLRAEIAELRAALKDLRRELKQVRPKPAPRMAHAGPLPVRRRP